MPCGATWLTREWCVCVRIFTLPLFTVLGVQVRNLAALSWFFQNSVFFYCMVSVSALTLIYLCRFPTDKRALEDL